MYIVFLVQQKLYILPSRKAEGPDAKHTFVIETLEEYMHKKRHLRLIGRLPYISALILLSIAIIWPHAAAHAQTNAAKSLSVIVKASPASEFQTRLDIYSHKILKSISALEPIDQVRQEDSDVEIVVHDASGSDRTYVLSDDGSLIEKSAGKVLLPPPQLREQLKQTADRVRDIHYGKLTPWEQAKQIVSKKDIVTVIDLETGLRFRAQRRAGSSHADVQPVTKEDTRIMKQIYGGKWSWKRRAILVIKGRERIAGSMHGMPHGGDGIPDNDFKGHFCIHFQNSVTHGTGNLDMAHQLMVMKAAGKLRTYLAERNPYELVELFMSALNQHDRYTASLMLSQEAKRQFAEEGEDDPSVESIQRLSPPNRDSDSSGLVALEVPVDTVITMQNHLKERRKLHFVLKRASVKEPWKIERIDNIPD